MLRSSAYFPTLHASKYLQQLCKHFAHKVAVEFDETEGSAALPAGPAKLYADPAGLRIVVSGEDAKALIHARYAIDSHLVTFAYRENYMGLSWKMDDPA